MNNETPTPGPWSVHTDDNGKHSVLGFGPLAHLGDSPRALANARLMAAAPSLLAALADLLAACPDDEIGTCPLLAAAHDAIAKTGVDHQTVDL